MNGSINQPGGYDRLNLIEDHNKSINIQNIAGVVDGSEIDRLRRLIFRSTKGKSYVYTKEYIQDDIGRSRTKQVYIIVFWDGDHIRDRIQKICDSFSGQRYDLPPENRISHKINEIEKSIQDASQVCMRTVESLREQLMIFDRATGDDGKYTSTIYIYKMFLAKEKALYKTLNMMKPYNQ